MYCGRLASSIVLSALFLLCTHGKSACAFHSQVHRTLKHTSHRNRNNKYSCTTSICLPSARRNCRYGHADSVKRKTTELRAAEFAAVGATVANFYKTSPFTAGFITASTRAAIADSIAQRLDECIEEFDWKRNLAMVLYSGVILGLCCEIMFNRIFPIMFPESNKPILRAVKMALFDVFINAPILWIPPAYLVQAFAFRYPKREAIQKYITDVRVNGLLKKYWSLWLPASLTNFLCVPAHFRVAFVAAVGFFWMIILSLVANKSNQDDAETCPVECPQEPEPKMDYPRAME